MSRRRKSSTPCMVRVSTSDLLEDQEDSEEVMDMEISTDKKDPTEKELLESSESSVEMSQEFHQESPGNNNQADDNQQQKQKQETFSNPVEINETNSEPFEQAQQLGDKEKDHEDRPPVIETVEISREGEGEEKGMEEVESDAQKEKQQARAYECKYCPFSTQNLSDFTEHVDSTHPNVILNPLYLCAVCNFNTKKFDSLTEHNESAHPGETNFKFKRINQNNQTILEQTIDGVDNLEECEMTNLERGQNKSNGNSNSPVSVFPPACIATTVKTPDSIQSLYRSSELKRVMDGLIMQKDQIKAVNINGTVIIPPDPSTTFQGLSHVTPMLQRPPNFNSVPKIAVPLNTTKYNPSLDDNLTLMTSFNKFPYPTHAELSWLTAVSKHPEDEIKVWFTTQRLKQGITWSPEEVEEARKKMFNGSIPPAHHTFTGLPTSATVSQPFAKSSHQQPFVYTTVRHPRTTTTSNGFSNAGNTNSLAIGSGLAHKRTHLTTVFGPESKRPIMAVAPHSGDPKDKVLMAPPPPPPPHPQKDRFVPMEMMKRPVATSLVTTDMKRQSANVPLMPPPSSLSKGKVFPPMLPNSKIKLIRSMPSMAFPDSLTKSLIIPPPPIFAPQYKNTLLSPYITSKDIHTNAHHASYTQAGDSKLQNSPPLISQQLRRPPIIQSIHKAPAQIQGFPFDSKKLKEQQGIGMEFKPSYPPARRDKVLTPLADANGNNGIPSSRTDGKWSHNQNNNPLFYSHNNGVMYLDGDGVVRSGKLDFQQQKSSSSVLTQFPLLERMKGKTAEQLKVLEENFLRNSFPTHGDVDDMASTARLSHQEIESWFVERRALRDNLEQALLNSMGTKGIGSGGGGGSIAAIGNKKRLNQHQHQTLQLNGIHKPSSTGVGNTLKSPILQQQQQPPLPLHNLPIIAPSSNPNSNPCSVPPADSHRSMATLLKDDFAETRWPSPEELSQVESGRTAGLAHAELARWFNERRLVQNSNFELTELFQNNGVKGGGGLHGPGLVSPENATPPNFIQRCQEAALSNSSHGKVLELELGWLMEQRANGLTSQQHEELQDRFAGRLTAGDVFGSWTEDGRRAREFLLDKERKISEDKTGRLTG